MPDRQIWWWAVRQSSHVALTVLHHKTRSADPLVEREIVAVISQKLPGVRGIPLRGAITRRWGVKKSICATLGTSKVAISRFRSKNAGCWRPLWDLARFPQGLTSARAVTSSGYQALMICDSGGAPRTHQDQTKIESYLWNHSADPQSS
jgi:hypothetical protein